MLMQAHTLYMTLETNLKKIQEIALQKREHNQAFRIFLEGQESDQIDDIVLRLNKEITPQIDCTACGNCCTKLRPIASVEVLKQFVDLDKIEEVKYAMSITCKHVKNKKCTQYLDRPEECRLYPYMDRDQFVSRIVGILQNYEICPIVYNICEHLKVELGWNAK